MIAFRTIRAGGGFLKKIKDYVFKEATYFFIMMTKVKLKY